MNDLDHRFENIHCAEPELRFLNVPHMIWARLSEAGFIDLSSEAGEGGFLRFIFRSRRSGISPTSA